MPDTGRQRGPQTVAGMVEERLATLDPGIPAVIDGDAVMTYGDLDCWAEVVAEAIRATAPRGAIIAVALNRSPMMVSALLGILRSRAAYVPFDLTQPQRRLKLILNETRPAALITESSLRAALGSIPASCSVVEVDTLRHRRHPARSARQPGESNDLAYLVYTSGSTGRPKGVAMHNAPLVNLLCWQASVLGRSARTLQFASIGFDVAFQEIFSTLTTGGTLVMIGDDVRHDPAQLLRHLADSRIERLFIPFTALQQLALAWLDDRGAKLMLSDVVTAGEQLRITPAIAAFLSHLPPGARLHNHYGPSETHVVTAWTLDGPAHEWPVMPPIGRPISGVRIYLMDERGQPVTPGTVGEICIGGAAPALGYFSQPALTADRFLPDPCAGVEPSRIYASGDIGRLRADGVLEFLGRADEQVKIRGYRVEPVEVESYLTTHPGVAEAAVVARREREAATETETARLHAFIVPHGDAESISDIRAFMRDALPEYMVPSSFSLVRELPRTPTGKLDRRNLRGGRPITPGSQYAVPRTPTERFLSDVWEELLGLRRVGRDDEFLDLGGDSLTAARVVTRVRRELCVRLPTRAVFAEKTIAAIARRIDALPKEADVEVPEADALERTSSREKRLWYIAGLGTEASVAYNIPFALHLRGCLDIERLERALNGVVARHEALRTGFEVDAGTLVRTIRTKVSLPLTRHSVASVELAKRERAARSIAKNVARQPFDLAEPPLVRAALIRIADEDHVVVVVAHHIVFDGWSIEIFERELAALYTGVDDVPVGVSGSGTRSSDHVTAASDLDATLRRLAGAPSRLKLPGARPRPPVATFRGASAQTNIDEASVDLLAAAAKENDATLFMALVSLFGFLIGRYTLESDFLIATPSSGRPADAEGEIGFFANTLVLRCDLHGDPTFSELIRRVRDDTLAALEHENVAFESVVGALAPNRDAAQQPLVQVAFAFDVERDPHVEGLEVERWAIETGTAKFDLTIEATRMSTGGVQLRAEWSNDAYDAGNVRRLLRHLANLAKAAAADPESRLADLPLADSKDMRILPSRRRVLGPPLRETIVSRFNLAAARYQDRIAASAGDATLTYAELCGHSDRLAAQLRALGVTVEDVVGVCVGRSLDLPVAVLGVLKAGAAYLPLEPKLPQERHEFMLTDAGARFVVVDSASANRNWGDKAVVLIEADVPLREATRCEPVSIGPANLAYVIYTSGSTGRPKGVMVEHGHVLRLFEATQESVVIGPSDVWTLFHSIGFDFSVWELWGALLHGGRLVIVPDEVNRSPEVFWNLIETAAVTILSQTPTAFRQLVSTALTNNNKTSLRYVIFGGEKLETSLLRPWFAAFGDEQPRLVNMYGITETTVHVTAKHLRRSDEGASASPIGCALADLQTYLLDERLRPCALGIPGEIYVGGRGVARGYLSRPTDTAAQFVPDPFSGRPGARLYRSGDVARLLEDGQLEFLGRRDSQLKVRGYRVEPGEIEARLTEHPDVREALVVVRHDDPTAPKLVGYLVPAAMRRLSVQQLHDWLADRLPHFMIPAAFVYLSAVPRTMNGKLDTDALPPPSSERHALGDDYVAPANSVELAVARSFARVLRLDRVGSTDDFFALGGDSILVLTLVADLMRQGIPRTVADVAQHRTVAALAAADATTNLRMSDGAFSMFPRELRGALPLDIVDAYPLTALQLGMLYEARLYGDETLYHDAVNLKVDGPFDADALAESLAEVTARHDVLRTSFALVRFDQPMQLVHRSAEPELEVVAAVRENQESAALIEWVRDERERSFNWEVPPLARFRFARRGGGFDLTLAAHHAILDGWSVASLLTEVLQRYHHHLFRSPAPPSPGVAYREFVRLEKEVLGDDASRAFWRSRATAAAGCVLPGNVMPDPGTDADVRMTDLPPELCTSLARVAASVGVPRKSLLFACHTAALAAFAGRSKVTSGIVVNGRPEIADAERTLGLFLNSIPITLDMRGANWSDLARATFCAEREATPYRRFPLSEIQRMRGVEPLMQVLFNYTNFHVYREVAALTGLRIISETFFEKTGFPVVVEVMTNALTRHSVVRLACWPAIGAERQARIEALFLSALDVAAKDPNASVERFLATGIRRP